jgi:hypothetical protein
LAFKKSILRRPDPDYYITADGKSGIVPRHVQAGAPYCLWYSHWQGLNPAKGVGWRAFTAVIERIGKYLHDRVIWMRPSEITDHYHAAGGWGFLDAKQKLSEHRGGIDIATVVNETAT